MAAAKSLATRLVAREDVKAPVLGLLALGSGCDRDDAEGLRSRVELPELAGGRRHRLPATAAPKVELRQE